MLRIGHVQVFRKEFVVIHWTLRSCAVELIEQYNLKIEVNMTGLHTNWGGF